jgi:hypothetical protein
MASIAQSARVTQHGVITDFFRCPGEFGELPPVHDALQAPGYFRLGDCTTGYGAAAVACPSSPGAALPDLLELLRRPEAPLPFDPEEVITNLLMERYSQGFGQGQSAVLSSGWMRKVYYRVRPLLPDLLRNALQRRYFKGWRDIPFPAWPVDMSVEVLREELLARSMVHNGVEKVPFVWFWPDGANAAAAMTHDVETAFGRDFIPSLLSMDGEFGIPASYQIVPEERYPLPEGLLDLIRARGGEVNVHDLTHDGTLFQEESGFRRQAERIRSHAVRFGAEGFRAACMYRNQAWIPSLGVNYDMSVPNVAHLEPQRGGCCTVFPYINGSIVELPLTMAQDFSVFQMLRTFSMDLWKQQMSMIEAKHGLMSFIAHPDYLQEPRPEAAYRELLGMLAAARDSRNVWIALPREVAEWWRARAASHVVDRGNGYEIEGPARSRGRIAYASIADGKIHYQLA